MIFLVGFVNATSLPSSTNITFKLFPTTTVSYESAADLWLILGEREKITLRYNQTDSQRKKANPVVLASVPGTIPSRTLETRERRAKRLGLSEDIQKKSRESQEIFWRKTPIRKGVNESPF